MKNLTIALIGFVLGLFIAAGGVLVYAASSGEDFEWLATTDYGVRIGGSGAQGGTPAADTLEFVGADGMVHFYTEGSILSYDYLGMAALPLPDLEGGFIALSSEAETGGVYAGMLGIGGGVGMASAVDTGYDVETRSAIRCTPDGDVIVDLGGIPEESLQGESEGMMESVDPFARLLDRLISSL